MLNNVYHHFIRVGNPLFLDLFRLYFTDCFHKDDCLRYVCKPRNGFTALGADDYFNLSFCTATMGHPYKLFLTLVLLMFENIFFL